MNELPASWVKTALGQVVSYADNETVDPADMPPEAWLLELEDIERDTGKVLERKTVGERAPKSSKNRFQAGDVLYGKLRPYLNKVVRADEDGFCSGEIIAISPGLLDKNYLFYSMRSPSFIEYVSSVSHGMRMPRLGTQQAKSAPFVLPPRAEQTRIAAKLDELLAQVDTLKARTDGIPALLKRFRQSVLAAAVSGRLTEEWHGGSRKNLEHQPFAYPVRRLGVLACFIDYRGKTPEKVDSGIPLITAKNIRPGFISREPREFIRPEAYEGWMTRGIPQVGDVVITTEAPLGNVAVIDIDEKFALAQRAICLQFHEGFLSSFAAIALQSPPLQEALARRSTGTTVKGIKASVLKEIELPDPGIDEQTEIVRRVEQLFAFADQLEARVKAAQARIDRLTQSILAKAFRGELVPQDPNDEPASVLLERIKAQRAAAPKAKRGRKASA